MAKQALWDFYDGEPFMQNPHLGILGGTMAMNPRRKRRNSPRKRYSINRRRGRKHNAVRRRRRSNPPRRRARRNWISAGMVLPPNPRRKHHRRTNPHRRRHRRSNPALLGMAFPSMKQIGFGVVGFAGPSFVSGFLTSTFPTVMQSLPGGTLGKYIVKGASIFGLQWLTRRFIGRAEAYAVTFGGALNIGMSLIQDFAPGILPANPLAMYIPRNAGMHAYVPVRRGLHAANVPGTALPGREYAPGTVTNFIPTAAPFTPQRGFQNRAGIGGVPSRYQRY
jgi:hypothetical protein